MSTRILHVLLLAAVLVASFMGVFPAIAWADGPAAIVLTNAIRTQWDESPVLACIKDAADQLLPGVAVTATLVSLTPNTQVLTTGANGCLALPVRGFLSTTTDATNLGEVEVKGNPSVRADVTVTITGPKPDVTGWISGMDVFHSMFGTNPDAAKWARDNATVFVQVAHPAIIDFGGTFRRYENWGALLPVGAPVKVYSVTGDFKWAKIVVQSPGWSKNYVWFPVGALSDKWPFPPANVAKADATGYVPGTPWNWTEGFNPEIGAVSATGQTKFHVRTKFSEIPENEFLNQRRTYGRELPVNEAVTVNSVTRDGAWANIQHAKDGPRYFVPTSVLSPGWTDSVKGQSTTTYKVVKGDTLSRLAKHYGVTVDALVTANGIAHPNLIIVGQVLVIPAPQAP